MVLSCPEASTSPSRELGRARRIDGAADRYIEFCKSTFPTELDLRGLKIALDCAHGAAYSIAPKVFHELGAEVVTVGCSPNGMNINDGVGATAPSSLSEAVRTHGADIGIALDGDADRLMMCDGSGRIYDGDELLYVIAGQRLREGRLNGVVGTLMTNLALEHALNEMGVGLARAKVGDRYVLETLHRQGWRLGGENSGHIIDLDRHTTGDGIVAALQVLAALRSQDMGLDQACSGLKLYPQKLVNVKLRPGFDWSKAPIIDQTRIEVEGELAQRGRVLLRPSGTEPLLRVMVEGQDAAEVGRLATRLAEVVKSAMAA